MSFRKSSLRYLLLVAACASVVACRMTERPVEKPATASDATDIERVQDLIRQTAFAAQARATTAAYLASGAATRSYTITLATFIPNNYVLAPPIHPQSFTGAIPKRLVFSGDDRAFDVDATRYRAKQVVTVVPDEQLDAHGLFDNFKPNLGGQTESFIAQLALEDGKLDDRDRRAGGGKLGPSPFHRKVAVDTGGMLIDDPIRLGPKRVSVRLHTAASGGPRDQLIAGAPSIDWDLTIIIDTSGPTPKYDVAGTWDGYPAMEIYINRQPVYQYRGEDRPPTMTDLMKLVPKYGDLKVDKSGTLLTTDR